MHDIYDDNYFNRLETMNIKDFLLNYKTNRNETTYFDFKKSVNYYHIGSENLQSQDYIDFDLMVAAP